MTMATVERIGRLEKEDGTPYWKVKLYANNKDLWKTYKEQPEFTEGDQIPLDEEGHTIKEPDGEKTPKFNIEQDTVTPAMMAAMLKMQRSESVRVFANKTNPQFKSKYADLSEVQKTLLPILTQYGFYPYFRGVFQGSVWGVELLLLHDSGGSIRSFYPINDGSALGENAIQPGDKLSKYLPDLMTQSGKQFTYGMRRLLLAAFNVPVLEDTDLAHTSGDTKKQEISAVLDQLGITDPSERKRIGQLAIGKPSPEHIGAVFEALKS